MHIFGSVQVSPSGLFRFYEIFLGPTSTPTRTHFLGFFEVTKEAPRNWNWIQFSSPIINSPTSQATHNFDIFTGHTHTLTTPASPNPNPNSQIQLVIITTQRSFLIALDFRIYSILSHCLRYYSLFFFFFFLNDAMCFVWLPRKCEPGCCEL